MPWVAERSAATTFALLPARRARAAAGGLPKVGTIRATLKRSAAELGGVGL